MEIWNEGKIKDFADVKGGKRLPKGKKLITEPNLHPYIRIKDLGKSKVLELNSDYEYVDDETQELIAKYIVETGDILVSVVGTIGLIAIVGESLDRANQTENCDKIINIKGIDRDYLYYYLISPAGQEEIRRRTVGAVQPKLPLKNVLDITVKYPSIGTQQKIVSILNSLDNKIVVNEQINRNLSEQASAYYENWKMSLTGEAVELSKVIDVRDGTHASPKPQDEGYPLVTSKHLFEYDVDLESPNKISQDDYDKTNERSKVEHHDVLMSMIGTVGVVSFISRQEINFAIKNVALFRTSQREELAYYVLLFLKSKDTKQYIKSCMAGSTQQYISLTELRKIPIIVPGEEIKEFNLVIKPIIDMICANVIENRRLSELRDTLLPKLMSGELDVSDLDI